MNLSFLPVAAMMAFASPSAASLDVNVPTRFAGTSDDMIVVAHRGCHNPAPRHGLGATPENSIAALEHCVSLGVDMMELDVRRTADGELVILHDDTVDRTTTGKGRVGSLTLAELRALRLLDNEGGHGAAATELRVPTLDEILAAARGRIMLNLDIKEAIYPEVIDAVLRAGMGGQVLAKTSAGPSTEPLASLDPYRRIPFGAVLMNPADDADLGAIARRQLSRPGLAVIELPTMKPAQLRDVVAAARASGVRVWNNTMWDGFIAGWGGDVDALRNPDSVWGRMRAAGISVLLTDEPEALLAYRARCCTAGAGTK